MLGKSPRDGVIMRQRQSSEMIATQLPVRSTGACARGVGGAAGACAPRPCAARPAAVTRHAVRTSSESARHYDFPGFFNPL